jgi:hypothetical protein
MNILAVRPGAFDTLKYAYDGYRKKRNRDENEKPDSQRPFVFEHAFICA